MIRRQDYTVVDASSGVALLNIIITERAMSTLAPPFSTSGRN